MKNKWFNSAAVKGSGFEHLADMTVELDSLTPERIRDIDILFTNDPAGFFSKFRGMHFTVICDREIPVDDQPSYLLESHGNFFLSRIGHDITNLFFPFEHFEYLEEDVIKNRTAQGIRFGKQINIIGHLLQRTVSVKKDPAEINNVIQTVQSLCRKKSISFCINGSVDDWCGDLPDDQIFNYVLEEIISNWAEHGTENCELEIKDRSLIFSNFFEGTVDPVRTKAKLRCPFRKKNTGTGAGLGLYIVSLASVKGGFDWDISVKENSFSLSLVF